MSGTATSTDPWRQRVESGDWAAIAAEVNSLGGALLPELLTPGEAAEIRELYEHPGHFRSTIDMSRYRFGEGEYRYFKCPYPEPVEIRGTTTNRGDLDEAHVVITNIQQLQGGANRWLTGLPGDYFDLILCDVPCTGTGTLSREKCGSGRRAIHRLVLWNIDQTLLDVTKVTRAAYAEAFAAIIGRPLVALPQMVGCTEPEIFCDALDFKESS